MKVKQHRYFDDDGSEDCWYCTWTPNDPMFDDQWHLLNTGQSNGTQGEDANLPAASETAHKSLLSIAYLLKINSTSSLICSIFSLFFLIKQGNLITLFIFFMNVLTAYFKIILINYLFI